MDFTADIANLLLFLNQFKGYDDKKLSLLVEFDSPAKNRLSLRRIKIAESYKGKEYYSFLCEQGKVQLKTVQLNERNKVKEARSFPKFDYEELRIQDFESSSLYQILSSYFLFCVFKNNVYLGSFLWKIPKEDLYGDVKDVWLRTKDVIQSGNIVKEQGEKNKLNFPSEAETSVCHVRPHGRNALDFSKLPIKDIKTGLEYLPKQSFWLNHSYLNQIIDDNKKLLLRKQDTKEQKQDEN